MKNQNINTANVKAEFLDIKTAKNPNYQPMAGKLNLNTENKATVKDEPKKEEIPSALKNEIEKEIIEEPKSLGAVVQPEGPKVEKPEALNVETKTEKPALNLEGTLKLVEELHRRMVQRGRLVYTIDNLDRFEIEQKEEAEETFFIVRIEVKTEYGHISETLKEMEKSTRFFMTNTPKVKVINSEILTTQTRNLKNRNHGA